MALDKLVDSTQLDADLLSVANAIRTKGGTSASLAFPAEFVSAIGDIPTGGGGTTKSISNIISPNVSLVKGYLASNGSISNPGNATKEVTTDYVDISAYAGTNLTICVEIGARNGPWCAVMYYDANKNAFGGRTVPIETSTSNPQFRAGTYVEFDGVSTALGIGTMSVPANAVYCRISFRTGGDAALVVSTDTSVAEDYFSREIKALAFVNPIESNGDAT